MRRKREWALLPPDGKPLRLLCELIARTLAELECLVTQSAASNLKPERSSPPVAWPASATALPSHRRCGSPLVSALVCIGTMLHNSCMRDCCLTPPRVCDTWIELSPLRLGVTDPTIPQARLFPAAVCPPTAPAYSLHHRRAHCVASSPSRRRQPPAPQLVYSCAHATDQRPHRPSVNHKPTTPPTRLPLICARGDSAGSVTPGIQ